MILLPEEKIQKEPDRASIVYTGLIKRFFKNSKTPIVLGGIEASLRRIVHYDYWSNQLRRSLIFDAKADILSYGMGEKSMLELAQNIRDGKDYIKYKRACIYFKRTKRKLYYSSLF